MAVSALNHSATSYSQDATAWQHRIAEGEPSFFFEADLYEGSSWPIGELDGTWVNVDCQGEQYVIQGQRVTRTNNSGTRAFSIQWDQHKLRWQWGTHGRLSLQWLGEDAIAWVPETAREAQHTPPRVWRWQRRGPVPSHEARELAVPFTRHTIISPHTVQPYTNRSGHRSLREDESSRDRYSSAWHRRSRHRSRSRNWSQGRRRSRSRRRSHSRHRSQRHHHHDHHFGGQYRNHRRPNGGAHDMHANTRLPCGLTPGEVYSLLSRDITPEDYELLLRLDEGVAKATAGADKVEDLPQVSCEAFMGHDCAVCLSAFEVHDVVVALPCQHHFHSGCITTWLSDYSKKCPLCCSEPFPA